VRTISAVLTAIALVVTACQQTGGGGATVTPGASASPTRGGTVVFAIWQEPNTMNPFHGTQTVISVATLPVLEGLVRPDPEGNYQPQLAASVPTLQNSGVSLDGSRMTVTYKLKDGITWSDGKPVTSSDVKFTWESLLKDPKVTSREGYDKIESIETPDPNTVVMRYKEIYAPYLSRFTVLYPKHVLDGVADISTHEYSRKPLGTGPFVVTEFKAADSITLERNPNYREKGKPYLDKIILRSVPSREVAIAQLKAGEVDAMWNILEAQIPDLDKESNVNLIVAA
jgi:peptide/nickel transport system substrate-binding protein